MYPTVPRPPQPRWGVSRVAIVWLSLETESRMGRYGNHDQKGQSDLLEERTFSLRSTCCAMGWREPLTFPAVSGPNLMMRSPGRSPFGGIVSADR